MFGVTMRRRILSGVLMFAFSYLARVIVSKIYPVKPTKEAYRK